MAIGRITGQMLSANLARSGTDLTFETNLLALDVSNSRVGIGTASPATTLHLDYRQEQLVKDQDQRPMVTSGTTLQLHSWKVMQVAGPTWHQVHQSKTEMAILKYRLKKVQMKTSSDLT